MRDHIVSAHKVFEDGCNRALSLKSIFEYLKKTAPIALNCDDILRSALVLSVSSFDLLIHDLYRSEVSYRLTAKKQVNSLRIPFNLLISDENMRFDAIDECIRKENSYKSFVAPDKLAECLRALIENPWDKISFFLGETPSSSKAKLKGVVDLRNRIAHEADVNPAYGGIELWPIYSEDVENSIFFLRKLGESVAKTLDEA